MFRYLRMVICRYGVNPNGNANDDTKCWATYASVDSTSL